MVDTGYFVEQALESLLNRRDSSGPAGWTDSVKNEMGLLKDMEALEAFLTPINMLKERQWLNGSDTFDEMVSNDFIDVIEKIRTEGWSPRPYLDEEFRKEGINLQRGSTDFSDSVSFFVTTYVDVWEYFKAKNDTALISILSDSSSEDSNFNLFRQAIDWIIENKGVDPESGGVFWEWGRKGGGISLPGLYFTYSILYAIDAFLSSPTLVRLYGENASEITELKKLAQGVYKWATNITQCQAGSGEDGVPKCKVNFRRMEVTEKMDKGGLASYILLIMQSCEQYTQLDQAKVKMVVRSLIDDYRNEKEDIFLNTENAHLISFQGIQPITYEDRTLIYVLEEGLSWAYDYLFQKSKLKDDALKKDMLRTIENLVNEVLNRQDKTNHLWNDGQFKIYYTQRSIEALTYYLSFIPEEHQMRMDDSVFDLDQTIEIGVNMALSKIMDDLKNTLIRSIKDSVKKVDPADLRKSLSDNGEDE